MFRQEAVEQASMGQIDPSTLTPSQFAVEKLIKEQNFNWKVQRIYVDTPTTMCNSRKKLAGKCQPYSFAC